MKVRAMRIFIGLLSLASIFNSAILAAEVFNFQIYREDIVDDGVLDFFTDYRLESNCTIEIDSAAVTANAFVDLQSSGFIAFECSATGTAGLYNILYTGPTSADQYEEDIFPAFYADYSIGLLFDDQAQPKRFSGTINANDINSGGIGFYDSNGDPNRFGSVTSYFELRLATSFNTPLAILLEPATIGSTLRNTGYIVSLDLVPANTNVYLLNGTYNFNEGSIDDNGNTVSPTIDSTGYITFDNALINPEPTPELNVPAIPTFLMAVFGLLMVYVGVKSRMKQVY